MLLTAASVASLAGCASLGTGLAAGGGGAAGGLIADQLSNGDKNLTILGAAVGSAATVAAYEELKRVEAEKLATAFEQGRRYEREVAAQSEWYKLTLMPDVPEPNREGHVRHYRNVKSFAPAEQQGGLNLTERPVDERVLP
jgi:hypothetical protein